MHSIPEGFKSEPDIPVQMADHDLGVPQPALGGRRPAPRGADQQTRRGEFQHHFCTIFFEGQINQKCYFWFWY